MKFLTWAALSIGVLVVAPLIAHLLRRRPPTELPFAAVALVPTSPAVNRARRAFEDRALLGLRALVVLALAVLGATPLLRCSRLSLVRHAGASVALGIVIDDSHSMRAPERPDGHGPTRYRLAVEAATDLLDGLEPGDAVAVVLAGEPARVALAATTNLAAVRETLSQIGPSDRGTDLDGAVSLAAGTLRALPHVDKRVVLLSDLLEGGSAQEPLAVPEGVRLWAPLGTIRDPVRNCAVVRADHVGASVVARVACSGSDAAERPSEARAAGSAGEPAAKPRPERRLELRVGDSTIAQTPIVFREGATDVSIPLPESAMTPEPAAPSGRAAESDGSDAGAPAPRQQGGAEPSRPLETPMVVALAGRDAADSIPSDDAASVVERSADLRLGVVTEGAGSLAPTGGPPPVEQALAALGLSSDVQVLPAVPDDADELATVRVLIVDDPPGFTPESRRHLASWLEGGGVLLIALGPRAAAAPLGAGFDPVLPAIVRWTSLPSGAPAAAAPAAAPTASASAPTSPAAAGRAVGIDPTEDELFGPTAEALRDVRPQGRAELELTGATDTRVRSRWADGKPFLCERRTGRGVVYAITLPLSVDQSDLVLRPAFLLLLQHVVDTARAHGGASRSLVGTRWTFDGYHGVLARRLPLLGHAEAEPMAVQEGPSGSELVPALLGLYELVLDGRRTERVASVPEDEILVKPRKLPESTSALELGGTQSHIDISRQVAFVLLALFAAEIALRAWAQRRRKVARRGVHD